MNRTDAANDSATAEAARRFVRGDSGRAPDGAAEGWTAADPANEGAMQRVELAVELARRLAAESTSVLHLEAVRAAHGAPRRAPRAAVLAWGTGIAAAVLVTVFAVLQTRPSSAPAPAAIDAARRVAIDAPSTTAAVLPNGIVVDASSVAVLPFAGADASLAAGLERDVAAALRTVPGLYVVADAAVQPYADTDIAAAELGGLLGARGLVDGAVTLVDGRVHVSARLREAATGETLWQTEVDRPADQLAGIRNEIADRVAAALFEPSARERVVREGRDDAPASPSKPFQQ